MRRVIKQYEVTVGEQSVSIDRNDGLHDTPIDADTGASEEVQRRRSESIIQAAQAQAERIIQAAELESAKLIGDTEKKCRELEKTVRDDAHKKGCDEGYAIGETAGKKYEATAREVLDDAYKTRETMLSEVEPGLVELVIRLVNKIVGSAAKVNPQLIRVLIKQAMNDIATNAGVKIRVSGEDYPIVEQGRDEIAAVVEGGADVEIVKDLSLSKNDCIIETPYGSVDCSLDGQLEQMKENLHLILKDYR